MHTQRRALWSVPTIVESCRQCGLEATYASAHRSQTPRRISNRPRRALLLSQNPWNRSRRPALEKYPVNALSPQAPVLWPDSTRAQHLLSACRTPCATPSRQRSAPSNAFAVLDIAKQKNKTLLLSSGNVERIGEGRADARHGDEQAIAVGETRIGCNKFGQLLVEEKNIGLQSHQSTFAKTPQHGVLEMSCLVHSGSMLVTQLAPHGYDLGEVFNCVVAPKSAPLFGRWTLAVEVEGSAGILAAIKRRSP